MIEQSRNYLCWCLSSLQKNYQFYFAQQKTLVQKLYDRLPWNTDAQFRNAVSIINVTKETGAFLEYTK